MNLAKSLAIRSICKNQLYFYVTVTKLRKQNDKSKIFMHLGIHLAKEIQDLYLENWEIFLKTKLKGRYNVHNLEDSIKM